MSGSILRRVFVVGTVGVMALVVPAPAPAQSSTRTTPTPDQQPPESSQNNGSGSGSHAEETPPLGLRGYCPVCLVEMKKWVKGDPLVAVNFDGRKYLFPGAEQAKMFQENPTKYTPVLGGDDVVHFSRTGERLAGSLSHSLLHQGRSYFFASPESQKLFQENSAAYENTDLALDGECIVCRVGMKQRVAGLPDFTVIHGGLRYQFPGQEQQSMFLKAPESFLERVAPEGVAGGGN